MGPFRDEIEALEQNGITRVALPRIGDPKVIALWFGEGDMVTPAFIRDAAKRALDQGHTFYAHTRGRQELRDAIKRYLDRLYGLDVSPERISVPGSSMLGITLAVQMAVGRGDHGVVVGPVWPNIVNALQVAGAAISQVRQRFDGACWSVDVADIERAITPATRVVFLNSPCNPTGWIMPASQQRELLEICRARNVLLIADEVYHRNVFAADVAPSFMTLARDDDPVIVINGFSKAFAMTGWRLGWMVHPARMARHLAILSECFNTGATVFTQFAGIAALDEGEPLVRELRARYARGREIVMQELATHPRVELALPEGAFYAFVRVPGMRSSLDFAQGLLAECDVGIAPGYTFGPDNDEYFRLCFAQSHDRLAQAMGRIRDYLDRHGNAL
jgi:aspartate/methionine/tyrosine aminotransferase